MFYYSNLQIEPLTFWHRTHWNAIIKKAYKTTNIGNKFETCRKWKKKTMLSLITLLFAKYLLNPIKSTYLNPIKAITWMFKTKTNLFKLNTVF